MNIFQYKEMCLDQGLYRSSASINSFEAMHNIHQMWVSRWEYRKPNREPEHIIWQAPIYHITSWICPLQHWQHKDAFPGSGRHLGGSYMPSWCECLAQWFQAHWEAYRASIGFMVSCLTWGVMQACLLALEWVCEGLRLVEGVLTPWMTVRLSKRGYRARDGMSSCVIVWPLVVVVSSIWLLYGAPWP